MSTGRRTINEDELSMLFMLIGQGIWFLQHVENALTTLITIKGEIGEVRSVSAQRGEELLNKHRKNTLGTSIRIAKDKGVLSNSLVAALDSFKEERDWLVHRSLHQNGDDLYVNTHRAAMLERLERFSQDAQALQRQIAAELESFVVSKGVSREWIYEQAHAEISKKQGK